MSLQTLINIFLVIFSIGIIAAIIVLIRDRIDIIRSIKPNSIGEFFGLNDFKSHTFPLRYVISRTFINIFALSIWVPFWILDNVFKLNIFKENNSK
tara:strand:+ start:73354 stop:73641 length:288 start_codon:yes stop_codon:yes gene_type:complete